jgi:hypothetical protein
MRPLMRKLGIPMVEIWNQSMPIWEYHHNYQKTEDCTHMCHPSAYQVSLPRFKLSRGVADQDNPGSPFSRFKFGRGSSAGQCLVDGNLEFLEVSRALQELMWVDDGPS